MSEKIGFEALEFEPHPVGLGGIHAIHKFPNGYGVSVIRFPYSYGGEKGLYELAVLNKDGALTYDTPVTSDVEGYLTPEDVTRLMAEVAALPEIRSLSD